MKTLIIVVFIAFFLNYAEAIPAPTGYVEREVAEVSNNSTLKKILDEGVLMLKRQVVNSQYLNVTNIQSVATSSIFVPDLSNFQGSVRRFVAGIGIVYDVSLIAEGQRKFNVIMYLEAPWDMNIIAMTSSYRY